MSPEPAGTQINVGSSEKTLVIAPEAIQAILDDTESAAKQIKAEELIDRRLLDALEKSGFFKRLWGK